MKKLLLTILVGLFRGQIFPMEERAGTSSSSEVKTQAPDDDSRNIVFQCIDGELELPEAVYEKLNSEFINACLSFGCQVEPFDLRPFGFTKRDFKYFFMVLDLTVILRKIEYVGDFNRSLQKA